MFESNTGHSHRVQNIYRLRSLCTINIITVEYQLQEFRVDGRIQAQQNQFTNFAAFDFEKLPACFLVGSGASFGRI